MHDQLLAHQAFLERLARRLVSDEAAAQDLVQDTWLRALTRPPREAGALRGWLGTVARRLAIEGARGGRRRHEREHGAARPEATDGGLARVDLRLDFQAVLLERLRALPETQRHVLALRYVEGLMPNAIARELGVSVTTVKARLRRGLATLREELDRQAGGERAVWACALLPDLARGGALATLGGGASAALVGGGILMTTGTKAAAVVLAAAALAGGWWLAVVGPGETPGAPAGLAAGEPERERQEGRRAQEAPGILAPSPETAREALASSAAGTGPAAVAAGPGWKLRVELGGTFGGEPARIAVRGRRDFFQWPKDVEVGAELSEPGSVLLDVAELLAPVAARQGPLRADALVVHAAHPDCFPATVDVMLEPFMDADRPPAEPLEARLALQTGAVILGRVEPGLAGQDAPLVIAVERGGPGWSSHPVASTRIDADGGFRIVVPRGGPHVVGAAVPDLRPDSRVVDALLGVAVDVGTLRLEPGAVIEGVALREGVPATEHVVEARMSSDSLDRVHVGMPFGMPGEDLGVAGERLEWSVKHAFADPEGRFQVIGLAPGASYFVELHMPHGRPHAHLHPAGRGTWPALLSAPSHGVVVRPLWSTIELALDLEPGVEAPCTLTMHVEGREPAASQVPSVGNIHVQVHARPGTSLVLEVELEGYLPERVEAVAPAYGEHLVVRLAPLPVSGPATLVIVLEGASLPEGTSFVLHDLRDPGLKVDPFSGRVPVWMDRRSRTLVLRDGQLLVEGLRPGRQHFLLYAGPFNDRRSSFLLDVELTATLVPGERAERRVELVEGGRLRLDVTDADGRAASARVELEGPAGRAPISLLAHTHEVARMTVGWTVPGAPNDVVPNLPAGRYRLRLELEGHAPEELDLEIRPGQRTDVELGMRQP